MNPSPLSTTWVLALALGVVGTLVIGAVLARRDRPGAAAFAWVVAAVATCALVAHGVIAWRTRAAGAPGTFNEHRWVFMAPWGRLGFGLALATGGVILALTWRATRGVDARHRAAIVGLRAAAVAIALVVFVEPAIELRAVAREPNRIAVLIDESESMALRDNPDGPRRDQRVAELLAASSPTFEAWRTDHAIDFYGFAESVGAIAPTSVGQAAPTGLATDLRKALEAVRARYTGTDLAGVVVISDGAVTSSLGDEGGEGAARDLLRGLETRVHTVLAARPGLRDLAVAEVRVDEFAFVRTAVKLEAVIRASGLPAQRIAVTLSQDGKPIREKQVEVPAGGELRVDFEVTPPRVGRYVYEISVPTPVGDAVPSNNRRPFVLRVIRDKIRVLQVAGQPSWDVRALRGLLKGNPNVDLISFFILRTQDSVSLVPNDEMSLIPFPTRELFEQELPSFDLVVLQNFEFTLPDGIGDYLDNIRAYVQGGGGLVMLGGAHAFASGGYVGTPIAAALPVELSEVDAAVDTAMFPPSLTEAGNSHPVTMLRYAARDNQAWWRNLPALEGLNLVGPAKPGASVLATHPTLRGRDGQPRPVIVAGTYKDGRTLAVMTDSLWHWGFIAAARPGDEGRAYERFWDGAMRWLIHDPDLLNLQLDTDAVEYTPRAHVTVNVRLFDREHAPLPGGQVRVSLREGVDPERATEVSTHEATTGDDGAARLNLGALAPGVYRVAGTAKVDDREVSAGDIFLVRGGGVELERPTGDPEVLRFLAETTNGRALGVIDRLPADLAFDPPRVVRVDRRTDVELWSWPGLLLLAVLLLGGEWLLRQRVGAL